LLQIESSLLYSGNLELTVNSNMVSNGDQLNPELNPESTTVSLDVNATNGEECSEEDVLSFSQTKDSLIINSVGRYPYTSSREPLGTLYVNTTHSSYSSLSNYGVKETDLFFDLGFGAFFDSSDVFLKNFISSANDLFFQLNFLDDTMFEYPLTTGSLTPVYSVGANETELNSINVVIDVYRFASNWILETLDEIDHKYKYSIDFNMPDNVNKLKLNMFNFVVAPDYNKNSAITPISYLDESNIVDVFESFEINLIDNNDNIISVETTNGNQSELIDYIVSDLDFSDYKTLELIIDYPNGDNLYIPDAVFFDDTNNNDLLDLDANLSEVVSSTDVKFINDSIYPRHRNWISAQYLSPIADNEFYIGSPITDLKDLR